MDIKKTLLEKIETEHVTPISQWKFLVRGYGLWAISGVLLIFGSLGVASVLYILTKNDWDIYSEIHESKLTHIITTLPFLWLALFVLMLALLYIDVKHTKHGYKYNALSLVLATFAASVFIGGGLHAAGFGEELDELIREKAPRQAHMFNPRIKGLSDPEHGVIMGKITEINQQTSSTTYLIVENPLLEDEWLILVQEDTHVPPRGVAVRQRIRALGEVVELDDDDEHEEEYADAEHIFEAHTILPFNTLDREFRERRKPPRPEQHRRDRQKQKNLPN